MLQSTLFRYLAKSYVAYFGLVLATVVLALLVSNIFDTLSRFKGVLLTLSLFLELISFKLLYLSLEILPLICFISTLLFLHALVKSCELVSILNSGVSIWGILFPVSLSAICIGVIAITMINPVASTLLRNYEKIVSKLENKSHNISISDLGIMVAENYHEEGRIFIVKTVDFGVKRISDITILFTDRDNNFISRIDADSGVFEGNSLVLHQSRMLSKDGVKTVDTESKIHTNLSIKHFAKSSLGPEYISFWQLPSMILTLHKAGISVVKYQIYYYKQLFKPLMMLATVLMAGCFTQVSAERKARVKLVVVGIASGFVVYVLSEICVAILTHQGMTPIFAILCSVVGIMILSIFVILHLHEAR